MTISEVTKTFNVTTRMLRYYDEIGLLPSKRKEDYAYRVYDQFAIRRLQQILTLRKLRIPLKKIAIIFESSEQTKIVEVFQKSVGELDDEISALTTIRDILRIFITKLNSTANTNIKTDILDDAEILSVVQTLSLSKINLKEEHSMDELNKASEIIAKFGDNDVKIVYLPPSTVAAATEIGDNAETESDNIMSKFINDVDLRKKSPGTKFYGFNNPEFDENGKFIRHKYEMWATMPDNLEVSAPLAKKEFGGGLYVVYSSKPVNFYDWKQFGDWLHSSEDFEFDRLRAYREDTSEDHIVHCSGWGCLEEHFNSYNFYELEDKKFTLDHIDFLIPIKEKRSK